MFLFPITYIIAFLKTIKEFAKGHAQAILIFICIGLPIYINSLSIAFMYGFDKAIGPMQLLKELVVLIALGIILYQLKQRPKFTTADWMVAGFLGYSFLFVLLPIGTYDFISRLLAFKSLSFFCILYFVGRFINAKNVLLAKPMKMIGVMTLVAAIIVLIEFIRYEHIHVYTGFTDFLIKYFDGEQSGNYGLIWTFETESGLKRFGSIFGSPLELGASMLLSISFVLAFYTQSQQNELTHKYNLVLTKFGALFLAASFVAVSLAVSRASFIGYLMIIGTYALITKNKIIIKLIYLGISFASLYLIYFIAQTDIYDFILSTITFNNASSLGHLLEWIDGLNAIVTNPFGLGLGESGRISMVKNDNTGGENQFIITGVQVGLPMLILYITIHTQILIKAYKHLTNKAGKIKRLAMVLFLFKIGIIIPMFTSNTEAFIYISYITWFLSGLLINLTEEREAA